jgi:hypothetical protein
MTKRFSYDFIIDSEFINGITSLTYIILLFCSLAFISFLLSSISSVLSLGMSFAYSVSL